MSIDKTETAREAALNYHEFPRPGKLEIARQSRWPTDATWPVLTLLVLRRPVSKLLKIQQMQAVTRPEEILWLW